MTKTNTVKTALAAVSLAAAVFALPTTAQARGNCSDTENAVAGAAIGGTIGTVLGEEIAGRGDRTEGAILGGVVGGIIGAAIGDGASDCEKTTKRYRTVNHYPTRTTYGNTRNTGYQTVGHHRGRGHARGHRNHRNDSYNYGYRNDPLYSINRQIENTRREGRRLKEELRYSRGYRPGLRRRIDENGYRLEQLKRERKRIKRFSDRRNDYYQPRQRRGHYHGSSRNLCYSDH